ncbi:hypothetical protein, partial [Phaeobacter sp. JH18-31]
LKASELSCSTENPGKGLPWLIHPFTVTASGGNTVAFCGGRLCVLLFFDSRAVLENPDKTDRCDENTGIDNGRITPRQPTGTLDIAALVPEKTGSCGTTHFCHSLTVHRIRQKKSLWTTHFRCSHSLTIEIALKAILGEATEWMRHRFRVAKARWPSTKSFSSKEN